MGHSRPVTGLLLTLRMFLHNQERSFARLCCFDYTEVLYSNCLFVCILALLVLPIIPSLCHILTLCVCVSDRTHMFFSCHSVASKVLLAAILPSRNSADSLLTAAFITVTGLSPCLPHTKARFTANCIVLCCAVVFFL